MYSLSTASFTLVHLLSNMTGRAIIKIVIWIDITLNTRDLKAITATFVREFIKQRRMKKKGLIVISVNITQLHRVISGHIFGLSMNKSSIH